MKRLLFCALMIGGLALRPAFAQEATDDFEKEFQAFKQKIEAAQPENKTPATNDSTANVVPAPPPAPVATAPKPTAPVAASPVAPASPLASPLGAPAQNPLGPAANLPLAEGGSMLPNIGQTPTPEEMQAEIEANLAEQRRKLDENTFKDALRLLMPMKPEQIRQLYDTFRENREAAETPLATPVPKIQVETVSLDPSAPPPVIKTSMIRVTTLTILDSTGAPWPIQDVSWAGKFEITPPEEGGHVVRITPMSAHGMGNLSIRLVDLITPVTFTLQTGLDEVHYRFDARIPKQGPLAKAPLIAYGGLRSSTGTDENLVQVLDGTPPTSSEKLKVEGVDGRTSVWRLGGRIYLRTPLTLLSPSWESSVASADGMNVYTLSNTPVLLLSDSGRMVSAHISADEVSP